jgi:exosome complex component RRP41
MHGQQPAVSPEGLRHDGRRPLEHRKMVCRIGGFAGDGSALFTLGNTHVAASVFGPREQRGSRAERAAVVVEVHVAAFASQERKAPSRKDKRSVETAVLVRQAFEAVVETERFPRSEIRIVLNVLGADGGMRVACLNAASLALAHAGVPMRDLVAACAVGRVGETMLMDPTLKEDAAGAHCNVSDGLQAAAERLCSAAQSGARGGDACVAGAARRSHGAHGRACGRRRRTSCCRGPANRIVMTFFAEKKSNFF